MHAAADSRTPAGVVWGDELPLEWHAAWDYDEAVDTLSRHRDLMLEQGEAPRLFLAEHPPVVTLGRRTQGGDVLDPTLLAHDGVKTVKTTRGGRATYHGPGQLMVYPVVRLRGSLVAYLEALAGALVVLGAQLGVAGLQWRRDPAGVWRGAQKVAACGVHLRRGVAIHGFALNVRTPQKAWSAIQPCGLSHTSLLSLEEAAGEPLPGMEHIAELAAPLIREALLGGSA